MPALPRTGGSVWTNALGGVEIEDVDNGITGRRYVAIEPTNTEADRVIVVAVVPIEHAESVKLMFSVQCVEFGAVPEGWDSPTELVDPTEFAAAYRPMNDAELSAIVLAQSIASREATAKKLGPSPWRLG